MKSNDTTIAILVVLFGMAVIPKPIFADPKSKPPPEIAVTFVGNYQEILIQRQQLAQAEGRQPVWIDVGPIHSIENWIYHANTTPGIDGRLSQFSPPAQIRRGGYIFELQKALGAPTVSDGKQSRILTEVPLAVLSGNPPEGYSWTGKVRQKTLTQIVSWSQDWRYRRLKEISPQ